VTAADRSLGLCRTCLRPVLLVRTERNKPFLLDPKPDPKGNQAAWCDSDGTWKTRQLSPSSDPLWDFEKVYMPHVATCPGRKPHEAPPLPPNVIPITQAASRRGTPKLPPRR
jgi:hypothetical protein